MFALILIFSTVFIFISINKHEKNTFLALFPEEASETLELTTAGKSAIDVLLKWITFFLNFSS